MRARQGRDQRFLEAERSLNDMESWIRAIWTRPGRPRQSVSPSLTRSMLPLLCGAALVAALEIYVLGPGRWWVPVLTAFLTLALIVGRVAYASRSRSHGRRR